MQACGALPEDNPLKGYDYYANYINAPLLYARATECGLASTVKLTPLAPDTCNGAIMAQMNFTT